MRLIACFLLMLPATVFAAAAGSEDPNSNQNTGANVTGQTATFCAGCPSEASYKDLHSQASGTPGTYEAKASSYLNPQDGELPADSKTKGKRQ